MNPPPPLPLTMIVPCRDEQGAVAEVVHGLLAAVPAGSRWSLSVLVVDDGSTDASAAILAGLGAARVLRHDAPRGYGAAIKTGLRAATTAWVGIIDADGTYPADRLSELLQWTDDADMVIAARQPQGSARLDYRRPFRDLYRRYGSWLAGQPVADLNSGFRLFRLDLARTVLPLLPDGFSLTSTLTLALMRSGHRVRFVPLPYAPRIGRSKINPLVDWMRFVQLIVRTGLYLAPWRVFGPVIALAWTGFVLCLAYDGLVLRDLTDKTLLSAVGAVGVTLLAVLADVTGKRR